MFIVSLHIQTQQVSPRNCNSTELRDKNTGSVHIKFCLRTKNESRGRTSKCSDESSVILSADFKPDRNSNFITETGHSGPRYILEPITVDIHYPKDEGQSLHTVHTVCSCSRNEMKQRSHSRKEIKQLPPVRNPTS
jgi:hypothetical protein